jgi:uncharacterized membrane protein YgcG
MIKKLLLIAFFFLLVPLNINALDITDKYDYNIIVGEDRVLTITETIDVNFQEPKHGIIKRIKLYNEITNEYGQTSKSFAKVSNINVNEQFETYREVNDLFVKIGDPNQTVIGPKRYVITYTYDLGKDPVMGQDELYFNLMVSDWQFYVKELSFNITLPKDFDIDKVKFFDGPNNQEATNITFNKENNTIIGENLTEVGLEKNMSIRVTFEEGYFTYVDNFKEFNNLLLLLPIIFGSLSACFWYLFGRDKPYIDPVTFYPPEGYNSAELGALYKGFASPQEVTSLIVYLANKGYIEIEEKGIAKGTYGKEKDFEIRKIKEYDGNNEIEAAFLNSIFMKKNTITRLEFGRIYGHVVKKIMKVINKKVVNNHFYDTTAHNLRKVSAMFIVILYVIMFAKIIIDTATPMSSEFLFMVLLIILIVLVYSSQDVPNTKQIYFNLIGSILIMLGISYYIVGPYLMLYPYYLTFVMIYTIGIIVIYLFTHVMTKRTEYGNIVYGQAIGFRNFLERAEKHQLENLMILDKEYFFKILPYTYVFGLSKKWINKFEGLVDTSPSWYASSSSGSGFDFDSFSSFTSSSLTSSNMSASSGGSGGGGAGGGGGSSW